MSTQSSALTVPAADTVPLATVPPATGLADLRVARVPEVWPPADGAQAVGGPTAPPSLAGHGPVARQPPEPRQFALLLAETLAGARPARQVLPLLSERGRVQLRRLLPLLRGEHRPRVLRVLTTTPSADVVEMTVVMLAGTRARALAVRLERIAGAGRWLCTDIEAG